MKTSTANKRNRLRTAGYRLHLKRLDFAGGTAIRTVKFPLVCGGVGGSCESAKCNCGEIAGLIDKVTIDYETLVGDINLSTWLRFKDANAKPPYSLLDFWADSLCAGVVFGSSTAKLFDFLSKYGGGSTDDILRKQLRSKQPEFAKRVDLSRFKLIVLPQEIRSTRSVDGFKTALAECLSDAPPAFIAQHQEQIVKGIWGDPIGSKTKPRQEQERFWQAVYGIDKTGFNIPAGVVELSAYLLPDLELAPKDTVRKSIQRYRQKFDDQQLEKVLGLSDNYNAFSNYFNHVLKRLRDNEVGALQAEMEAAFGKIGLWKGRQDELTRRLKWLAGRAKKLKADKPSLAGTWADYRSVLGGKLSSWFTNYLNQNAKIVDALYAHQSDFKELKSDMSDNPRPDLMKKYDVNYSNLKSANPELWLELERESSDCSATLEELLKHMDKKFHSQTRKLGDYNASREELWKTLDDSKATGISNQPRGLDALFNQRAALEKLLKDRSQQNIDAGLIRKCLGSIDQLVQDLDFDLEQLELYRAQLRNLHTNLNQCFQAAQAEPEQETKVARTVESRYKGLYNTLRLVPEFFGEATKARYEKYAQSFKRIEAGLKTVEKLSDQLANTGFERIQDIGAGSERIRRALDTLRRTHKTATPRFKQVIEQTYKLFGVADDVLKSPGSGQRFHISKHSRNAGRLKAINVGGDQQVVDNLPKLMQCLRPRWDSLLGRLEKKWDDEICDQLLDAVEIEKVRFGLSVEYGASFELRKTDLDGYQGFCEYFANAEPFFNLNRADVLKGALLGRFFQQVLFAELRGTLSGMSRAQFKANWVAMPIGSEKKWPLMFVPCPPNGGSRQELTATNRKEWRIDFSRFGLKDGTAKPSKAEQSEAYKLQTKELHKPASYKLDNFQTAQSLKLRTSRHQLQFLDNSLPESTAKQWLALEPKIGEYSLVAERQYANGWSASGRKLTIAKQSERLYLAIPFTLKPAAEKRESFNPQQYIGIDVGEYGLGYTVLKPLDNDRVKVVSQGFIHDAHVRKVRDYFNRNAQRQAKGTFGIPSTKLERLRENAITILRNRVHALAVAHNAKPVYEFNISNFETGSGKVSRIYNSVKRADVPGDNSADDQERALVWGRLGSSRRTPVVGGHFSAYATSYICSKCHRSIYELDRNKGSKAKIKISEVVGRLEKGCRVELNYDANPVKGFLSDRTVSVGSSLDREKAFNACRKYARPPIGLSPEVLGKSATDAEVKKFKKHRGNSALFRCPFCNHVSDADIQASQTIALRGWLRDTLGKISLKDELAEHGKLRLSAVEFTGDIGTELDI